jgi:hypothetical protein
MPMFYFHVRSAIRLTIDDEGADFADCAAALREATPAAREMLADAMKSGKPLDTLVIGDASGKELGTISA